MAPHRVLVVYATMHGQTARVSERIADHLRARGIFASRFDVADLPADLPLDTYDGVIIGASVHHHHHQASIAAFLKAHRDELLDKHTAFFSVSFGAGGKPEARAEAHRTAETFLAEQDFHPELEEEIAGALRFSRAGVLAGVFMRHLEHENEIDNPWDQDLELTDWAQVDAFTERFAELLGPVQGQPSHPVLVDEDAPTLPLQSP